MLRPSAFIVVTLTLWHPGAQAMDAARPADRTVQQVCSACHGAGLLGSPQIGDGAAWSARLKAAGSVDGLLASAVNGKNSMPPRGGDSELSDAELRGAIEFMLKQSGVQ